jgi:divalent metal cation (Fe/Co/Zn/Cd) transporter
MKFITYYYLGVGLIFYTLGILALYEGVRSGVFQRLINTDILIPLLGLIIAVLSVLWGLAVIGMGINDLTEGEENG